MVFTASAPHRFSSHALSRPHSNGPTPPVRRFQAAASMVVPLLTKHPAWDGASPCPATMETMEINAAVTFNMAMAAMGSWQVGKTDPRRLRIAGFMIRCVAASMGHSQHMSTYVNHLGYPDSVIRMLSPNRHESMRALGEGGKPG